MSAFDLPPPVATRAELVSLLAPPTCGWSIAMLLYGVFLSAHFRFVCSPQYRKALWQVRALLWTTFTLLGVYMCMVLAEQILWTVNGDNTLEHILYGTPFESFPPLLAGIVAASAQSLLMWRTISLMRSRFWRMLFGLSIGLCILLSLIAVILLTASNLLLFYDSGQTIAPFDFNSSVITFLWLSAIIDVSITIALFRSLSRRHASFRDKTETLAARIVRNVVCTASYTAFLSICGAVVATAFSKNYKLSFISYAFFSLTPAAHGIALYSTLGSQRNIEDYLGPSIDIPGSEILKVHVSAISTTVSRPATVPHLLLQPPAWRDHGGRAERTTTAGLEREWDGGVGSLRTRAREEKEDGDDDRTRVHGMV